MADIQIDDKGLWSWATKILPFTIPKKLADIGEKTGIVVRDKENIGKVIGRRKPSYASAQQSENINYA